MFCFVNFLSFICWNHYGLKRKSMNRLSTMSLRKHPGGFQANIKWIKWLLSAFIFISLVSLFFSISFAISERSIVLPVQLSGSDSHSLPDGTYLSRGYVEVTGVSVLDVLAFDHADQGIGWYRDLPRLLICWFLLSIFSRLVVDRPFQRNIMPYIGGLAAVFYFLAGYYLFRVIYAPSIFQSYSISYSLYSDEFLASFSTNLLLAVGLSMFAFVFKKGCVIQEERELTI